MDFITTILLAVGLSMDAMAVSISCGLTPSGKLLPRALRAGLAFGLFQAGMTTAGWLFGSAFSRYIAAVDHYVALLLLGWIGFNMIREGLSDDCEPVNLDSWRMLLTLAVATSIDALVAGVSIATLSVSIWFPAACIGLTTFTLSFIGVYTGAQLCRIPGLRNNVGVMGGVILIGLGLKIFAEHVFF